MHVISDAHCGIPGIRVVAAKLNLDQIRVCFKQRRGRNGECDNVWGPFVDRKFSPGAQTIDCDPAIIVSDAKLIYLD